MDQSIRNKLRGVVTQCRKLLEEAVRQVLQGQFGIYESGKKDEVHVEDEGRMKNLSDEDKGYRRDIQAHLGHIEALGYKAKDALAQLVREIAFTHLNRLCAYKMMEARAVWIGDKPFRESVSRGKKSQGFQFYLADQPEDKTLFDTGHQDVAYRRYLGWLGELLSEEIGVLFSPTDPANRLFPPQRVLDDVLALLNSDDLKDIWAVDETIGWVYQYFTPKELRDQVRKESAAPRNSYELAFRNQFFTPRYVVEFLTDNTLGRIWYEMRKGGTKLKDQCRYMVRRPNEIFLIEGQTPPEPTPNQDELSQEELLKQPVHIPHRSKKDPRELRILDPACGSGHFLLYCFDLLLTIYEEAYADPDLGSKLQEEYKTLADFQRDVPRLILAHNLHGIDIDLRASQIAALALWLRCQRAYREMGLKQDRPKITKSNFVCAEPMPGESEMLKEFVANVQPKVLGHLVEIVFDKMKLAGEAGSLLKIEEELREAIADVKKKWVAETEQATNRKGQPLLFTVAEMNRLSKTTPQPQLFDFSEITDEQFWNEAENQVLAALRNYSAHAANGGKLKKQLFAEDAERGFSFIDLSQKRFDVVLMNPPFGTGSRIAKKAVDAAYPLSKNDLYAAFIDRGLQLLTNQGLLGAITSRTAFFLKTFQKWREELVLSIAYPTVFADLGAGVLDSAMVETAAYCLQKGQVTASSLFIRATYETDKAPILKCPLLILGDNRFLCHTRRFSSIPNTPFAYWTPDSILCSFRTMQRFSDHGYEALTGASTKHNARFIRLKWEVRTDSIGMNAEQTRNGQGWVLTTRGGKFSRYYGDLDSVIDWFNDGESPKAFISEYYESKGWGFRWNAALNGHHRYFQAGLTWPLRGEAISVRLVARGGIPGFAGKMAYAPEMDLFWLLAVFNSCIFDSLVRLFAGKVGGVQYEAGLIQQIPLPDISPQDRKRLGELAHRAWAIRRNLDTCNETSQVFTLPALLQVQGESIAERTVAWSDRRRSADSEVNSIQADIDSRCFELYGINESDRRVMMQGLGGTGESTVDEQGTDAAKDSDDESDDAEEVATDETSFAAQFASWMVGVVLGRFDVRLAAGPRATGVDLDPLTERPAYSPGMLTESECLLSIKTPKDYPLRIDGDGIIPDDSDHSDDIVRRVREVLELIWKNQADAIEKEACEILGVKELRDYFRKPGKGGFWDDHVSRYSKSRRKAPIYWLLQSSKKNYGLWLYYQRLDKDILFKARQNYVDPKIRFEQTRLDSLRSQKSALGADAKGAKKIDKDIEKQEALLGEIKDFADKLERAAKLNFGKQENLDSNVQYDPDLNDGVVLNIASLWELVPWKEAKNYWEELLEGKYEWSSMGKLLRKKGLLK